MWISNTEDLFKRVDISIEKHNTVKINKRLHKNSVNFICNFTTAYTTLRQIMCF